MSSPGSMRRNSGKWRAALKGHFSINSSRPTEACEFRCAGSERVVGNTNFAADPLISEWSATRRELDPDFHSKLPPRVTWPENALLADVIRIEFRVRSAT